MMQFTETAPPPPPPPLPLHQTGLALCLDPGATTKIQPFPRGRQWPGFPTSTAKSLGTFNTAGCMEQLLAHCADAIESNDATVASQILWVLNNIAPPNGDSNQRLASAFLRALVARASKSGSCAALLASVAAVADLSLYAHRFSAVDLASFIDLTPWHRFGYSASNAAIADAVEGFPVIHVVDLSTTHCMQIPTLIDLLANRPEGPPFIKLTFPATSSSTIPPMLDISDEEVGSRLVAFARSRNVGMEYRIVSSDAFDGFDALLEQVRTERGPPDGEAMVVNCQMVLHCIADETGGVCVGPGLSMRSAFLKAVRRLEPNVVSVVEEDADFTAEDVVGRLRSAFNYLWIAYDAVEALLPRASERRRWYEAAVCWKIENVVAHEGVQRVERLEKRGRWGQRMRGAGFRAVGIGEEAAGEVKSMVEEHAAGWGMKKEEEDLVLTWKGHNVVFASAWVPC